MNDASGDYVVSGFVASDMRLCPRRNACQSHANLMRTSMTSISKRGSAFIYRVLEQAFKPLNISGRDGKAIRDLLQDRDVYEFFRWLEISGVDGNANKEAYITQMIDLFVLGIISSNH